MSVTTREEIITMLKKYGPMTVSEMAKRLDITEMAVRRHLNTMERDALIETKMVRQAMGRPTHLYHLTEEAEDLFPKNYLDLTIEFLREIEESEGREKVHHLFDRRKQRLERELKPQMEDLGDEEKIALLAEIQNKKGYMVDLRQAEDGHYILTEYNCPISRIAKEYNVACDCELQLFRDVLGLPVQRNECYANGGSHCVFVIETAKGKNKSALNSGGKKQR